MAILRGLYMKKVLLLLGLVGRLFASIFDDLEVVSQVDKEINDRLPFFYNASFVGGVLEYAIRQNDAMRDYRFRRRCRTPL